MGGPGGESAKTWMGILAELGNRGPMVAPRTGLTVLRAGIRLAGDRHQYCAEC